MNEIEKRIRETIDEADVSKLDIIQRLTQLYHQLLSEERQRLIGVVEEMRPSKPYPNASNGYQRDLDDEDKTIDQTLSAVLEQLKKEKD